MPALPPCERVLLLRIKYASVWKIPYVAKPVLQPVIDHGQNEEDSLTLTFEIFS